MDPLLALIRDVPDFPKPGILFKDITPLFGDAAGFKDALGRLEVLARGHQPDVIAAIEARGFLLGAPLADRLGVPLVPIRKPGKLPAKSRRVDYGLEYGTDALEVHVDGFRAGQRVLIVDDILATGGTAGATAQLVRECDAVPIAFLFLIELSFLDGRTRLAPTPISSVLSVG